MNHYLRAKARYLRLKVSTERMIGGRMKEPESPVSPLDSPKVGQVIVGKETFQGADETVCAVGSRWNDGTCLSKKTQNNSEVKKILNERAPECKGDDLCKLDKAAQQGNTAAKDALRKHYIPMTTEKVQWKNSAELDQICIQFNNSTHHHLGTHAIDFQLTNPDFALPNYVEQLKGLILRGEPVQSGSLSETFESLKKKKPKLSSVSFILNHDIHKNGGTHWVAVIVRFGNPTTFYYIDSGGTPLWSPLKIRNEYDQQFVDVMDKIMGPGPIRLEKEERKLIIACNVWLLWHRISQLSCKLDSWNVEFEDKPDTVVARWEGCTSHEYRSSLVAKQTDILSGECGQFASFVIRYFQQGGTLKEWNDDKRINDVTMVKLRRQPVDEFMPLTRAWSRAGKVSSLMREWPDALSEIRK